MQVANRLRNHRIRFRTVLRIRDVYPGSRISDPGSQNSNKKEGWKKIFVIPFYLASNVTKLNIILVLKFWRKKFGPIFWRIIELFTQKIVTKLSKIWVRDPGSEKNLFRIPDPGVKMAPDPGSGSTTLVPDQQNLSQGGWGRNRLI